jgi:hypothetical protein
MDPIQNNHFQHEPNLSPRQSERILHRPSSNGPHRLSHRHRHCPPRPRHTPSFLSFWRHHPNYDRTPLPISNRFHTRRTATPPLHSPTTYLDHVIGPRQIGHRTHRTHKEQDQRAQTHAHTKPKTPKRPSAQQTNNARLEASETPQDEPTHTYITYIGSPSRH